MEALGTFGLLLGPKLKGFLRLSRSGEARSAPPSRHAATTSRCRFAASSTSAHAAWLARRATKQ